MLGESGWATLARIWEGGCGVKYVCVVSLDSLC